MPKYNVMVNRTRTIEESVEIEVSAKDEEGAEAKIQERIDKATDADKIDKAFDWEVIISQEDGYEFEVSEA